MLVSEGDGRTAEIDIKLAASFAGIAGALNAAGYQSAGLFSANMTGNVSALSDQIGLGRFGLAAIFASLMVAFVSGAFACGLVVAIGQARGIRGIYAYCTLIEAALLLVLALADLVFPTRLTGAPLLFGLSFVMGLQNATTTRISNSKVRTTHVSGMATDIGLHLAALVAQRSERTHARDRLALHGATLLAFLIGGIAGVLTYLAIGPYLLVLTALLLTAMALPEVRRAKSAIARG